MPSLILGVFFFFVPWFCLYQPLPYTHWCAMCPFSGVLTKKRFTLIYWLHFINVFYTDQWHFFAHFRLFCLLIVISGILLFLSKPTLSSALYFKIYFINSQSWASCVFFINVCTLAVTLFKDVVPGCAFPPLIMHLTCKPTLRYFISCIRYLCSLLFFISRVSLSWKFVLQYETSDLAGISMVTTKKPFVLFTFLYI